MRRLRWRTTGGLVGLGSLAFAIATFAIGIIAYRVTHEALEQQLDHRIAAETAGLLAEANHDGSGALAIAIERREKARSVATPQYLLVDEQGRRIAGSLDAMVPAKPGFEEFLYYSVPGQAEQRVAQALVTRVEVGTLVVATDRADLNEIDRTLVGLFTGAFATMLAAGTIAAGLIGWLTRRRLSRIDATAQAIIDGDLSQRIPRDGSDSEFDRLAGTLNRMLDRIVGLMENLRQVSSDVAHDLRTPLTRLHASLDAATQEENPTLRLQAIDRARGQAAELLELFSALLRIAEIEGMAERLPRQRLDLSALVEKMAESYRPDIEDSGRTLQCAIEAGLTVDGDRRLVSQAITNLLDNSLRHSPAGSTVSIHAARHAQHARIVVSDDGHGVADEDRERLFQRFARSERSRSTPGHGLGLSLVRAVAMAHGGSAVLLDRPAGFGVAFDLPKPD